MRIAHVAPTPERVASGVQTVVEALATALSRRGHDVEIWHIGDWSPPFEASEADQMRAAGVGFRRLSSRRRRGSLPVVDLPIVLPPTSTLLSVTDGVVASSDHMSRAFGMDASAC